MAGYGYTEDEVINAYLMGKEDALAGRGKALLRVLRENVGRCADLTDKLLFYIEEKGFSAENAYLRINDIDLMEVMVCVPEGDFLDDGFLEVYGRAMEIEKEAIEDGGGLRVEFSFLDFDEQGYNAKMLAADGYIPGRGEAA